MPPKDLSHMSRPNREPPFERRQRLHQHIESAPRINIIEHIETHSEPLFRAMPQMITKASLRSERMRRIARVRAIRG